MQHHDTIEKCERRGSQIRELPIPLAWLRDGVEDCLNGTDEDDIWPTCGSKKSLRLVASNQKCENVYLCPWGDPGYVEYSKLPYETYLYGTKFGDFWKKSPYFRTTRIVTAISISHTLIFM